MTTVAISGLPVATVINAADIVPFVQTGTTKSISKTLLFTSPTMVTPVLGAATATSLAVSGLVTVGTTFGVTGAVTLASTLAVAGVSTLTAGAVIQGLTVGRGLAAIATNTAAGASALSAITTGSQNTAVGANAAKFIQAADNCVAVGNSALINATAGNGNTSIGSNTLTAATPGALNTALGNSALQSATGGSNTAVGSEALMSAAGACVALGNTAGKYEIGANAFYVNNIDRTSNINERALSLLYGTFNTTAATQSLAINGTLAVSEITGTRAAAATIASAATIAPTKDITFISGTAAVVTITAIAPFTTGGGTITLIPTGIFTWTTAGNIALAGTAVVSRALTMTYDSTTTKWYPSYV